jgi:hypothetical protein
MKSLMTNIFGNGSLLRWSLSAARQLTAFALFIACVAVPAVTAYAAKDFEVRNNTNSFFYVNGTTGNVGVGSTAPQSVLDVQSATAGARIATFGVSGSSSVVVDANGNVGIGSAEPLAVLDVKGGAARVWSGTGSVDHATTAGSLYVQDRLEVDGDVYLGDAVTDRLTVLGALTLSGNTNYTGPITITTTHTGALLVEKTDGTDVLNINTQGTLATLTGSMTVSGDSTFAANTTVGGNAIVNGNVGIGTTIPGQKLEVQGDGAIIRLSTASSPTTYSLDIKANYNAADMIDFSTPLGGTFLNYSWDVGSVAGAKGTYVGASGGRVILNGNVGIGSIAPRTKLDVNGGMQISGLSTLSGGAVISADVTLGTPSGNYTSSNADLLAQGNVVTDSTLYGGSLMLTSGGNTVNAISTSVSSGSTDLQLPTAAAVYNYVTSGASTLITDSDTKVFLKDGTDTPINFQIDGSTSVVIDRNGNVGVGVTGTHTKMEIIKDSSDATLAQEVLRVGRTGGSSVGSAGRSSVISFFDSSNSTLVAGVGGVRVSPGGNYNGSLAFYVNDTGGSNATNVSQLSEAMRISNTGNVGIGSTTPLAKLQVEGGILIRGGAGNEVTGSGSLLQLVSGYASPDSGRIFVGDGTGWRLNFSNRSGSGVIRDLVSIYDTGSVGIGTTTPAARLNVVGSGTGTNRAFEVDDSAYSPKVVVLDNGNVGIGSAAPLSSLDVKGGSARVWSGTGSVDHATTAGSLYVQDRLEVDGDVYLGDAVTDRLTVLGALTLSGNTNYTGPITITTTHTGALLVEKTDGTDVLNINTEGTLATLTGSMTISGDSTFAANTTIGGNAFVNGNVGIGSHSPMYTLDVKSLAGNNATYSVIRSTAGGFAFGSNNTVGSLAILNSAGSSAVSLFNTTGGWRWSSNLNIASGSSIGATYIGTVPPASGLIVEGNVGIGSIDPRTKLDVAGGMQISGLSTLTGGAVISADVTLGTPTGNYTSSDVDLLAQGNVVTDSTLYGGSLMLTSGGNTVNAISTSVSSGSTDLQLPTAAAVYNYVTSGASTLISDSDTKVFLKDGTATPINFQIDGSTSVVIDRNGNMGIGTATPASSLHVNGTTRTSILEGDALTIRNSTDHSRYILLQSGSIQLAGSVNFANGNFYWGGNNGGPVMVGAVTSATTPVYLPNNNDTKAGLGADAAGDVSLIANNSGTATEMLRITGTSSNFLSGNVGIATTGPVARLNVVGTGTGTNRAFEVDDSTYAPKVVVLDNGNMGIGSAEPLAVLDVKGGSARVWSGTGSVDYATTAGSLYVQDRLEVDGDVYLGDAVTDRLTVLGALTLSGNTNYTGPITITTTHTGALLVEKTDGTDVLNINTEGTLATLTGSMTISGDSTFAANTTIGGNAFVNGNVGIGTSTSAKPLSVRTVGDPLYSASWISFYNDTVVSSNRDFLVGLSAYSEEKVLAGAVSAVYLTVKATSGNLGLGTTVPTAKLNVVGAGTTTSRAFEVDDSAYTPKVVILSNGNVGIGSSEPQAKLEVQGGLVLKRVAATTDYTVTAADYLIAYTALAAARTVTLPDAVCQDGRMFVIKDESGNTPTNNIIIDPEGATTIDGAATFNITGAYNSVDVYCAGNKWYIK